MWSELLDFFYLFRNLLLSLLFQIAKNLNSRFLTSKKCFPLLGEGGGGVGGYFGQCLKESIFSWEVFP